MPVTDLWREFGPREEQDTDVGLPYVIRDRESPCDRTPQIQTAEAHEMRNIAGRYCAITIDTNGPAEYEKWYAIWKKAAALTKLCAFEKTKGGTAYGLGEKMKSSLNLA